MDAATRKPFPRSGEGGAKRRMRDRAVRRGIFTESGRRDPLTPTPLPLGEGLFRRLDRPRWRSEAFGLDQFSDQESDLDRLLGV